MKNIKNFVYPLILFILPAAAFALCATNHKPEYCDCKCGRIAAGAVNYGSVDIVKDCCVNNWGGYGNDGDKRCCPKGGAWSKSGKTCVSCASPKVPVNGVCKTPCPSKCPAGQTRNSNSYVEDTGGCCGTPPLKPYTETVNIVKRCNATSKNVWDAFGLQKYEVVYTCNTTPVSTTIYRGGKSVRIAQIGDPNRLACGRDYYESYIDFQGGTQIGATPTCPDKSNEEICAGVSKGYACLKPYSMPNVCPTYTYYGHKNIKQAIFFSYCQYQIGGGCAPAIGSTTLLTCK